MLLLKPNFLLLALLLASVAFADKNISSRSGEGEEGEEYDPAPYPHNLDEFLSRLSPGAQAFTLYSNATGYQASHQTWCKNSDYPFVQPAAGLVVRPATVRDVSLAVKYAQAVGLEFAVISGGHSIGGTVLTNGGLLLDLQLMKKIKLSDDRKELTIQGGVLVHEVANFLRHTGLVAATGICPDVGFGFLHGGWGGIARLHGLGIDNILSLQLVTADGKVRFVDETHYPDLWWACRGDFSNFGVMTQVVVKVHDISDTQVEFVYQLFPPTDFAALAEWSYDLIPQRNVGNIIVPSPFGFLIHFCWSFGLSEEEFDELIDSSGLTPIKVVNRTSGYYNFLDTYFEYTLLFPDYAFVEARSGTFTPVTGDNQFVTTFQDIYDNSSGPILGLLEMWGGAISDVGSYDTAFFPRTSWYKWWLADFWYDGRETEARKAKVEAYYESLIDLPGVSTYSYVNFLTPTPMNMMLAFGDNVPRLQQLKEKYDPENFFSKGYVVKYW